MEILAPAIGAFMGVMAVAVVPSLYDSVIDRIRWRRRCREMCIEYPNAIPPKERWAEWKF